MAERPPGRPASTATPSTEASPSPRDQWVRDDDELLLLDELVESDEAPDDEQSDSLL